jgi:hypothetical protein
MKLEIGDELLPLIDPLPADTNILYNNEYTGVTEHHLPHFSGTLRMPGGGELRVAVWLRVYRMRPVLEVRVQK